MLFNSYVFILLFLPVFVLAYYLLNKIHKTCGKLLIIAAGIVFYIYGGIESFIVLCVSIVLNLLASLMIKKAAKGRKACLISAIVLNIALLLYYKYSNFALSSFAGLLGKEYQAREILLPLGISFFTFQQIIYVVSVYREEIDKVALLDYLAYIFYFPKLIMGPLTDAKDFISQLNDENLKKCRAENIASGIKLFSLGLFKKMVLADTFAKGVAWGFANQGSATSGDLFLVMLFYTFEIYFDFSGYSDMAVGVSKIINITLPMNFDSPYKALSIRDFWKRWHVSLTGFLTKYVYFPLGGSRKGTARTYMNILIVFLVSGLWHGANWTFILWGILHGILQVIERAAGKITGRQKGKTPWYNIWWKWLLTFAAVNLLWLLFRADSVGQWIEMLQKMFAFGNMSISKDLIKCFELPETPFLLQNLHLVGLNNRISGFPMLAFILAGFGICLIPENNYRAMNKLGFVSMILCAAAFVWAFLCLSSESVFVYFNF